MNTPWRVELFGWLRAECDGRIVARFATQKTGALLACLALWPRRTHAREELIDRLWPDVDLDVGRPRLRQALASLRRQLEPPGTPYGSVLISDRTYIRLNPDAVSTDVAEFEDALRRKDGARAVTLYRSELLPGFYEDWIVDERERLDACYENALALNRPSPLFPPLSAHSVPSEPAPIVRLPMQFTRFFGREADVEQIFKRLDTHRLVTLTGPGGAGKTRLAIETARRAGATHRVAFVSLADLVPASKRIAPTIAEALLLPANGPEPPLEQVVIALSETPALLVLDNLEHLVAEAAPLVQTLLSRLPSLSILVTSRRRLHAAGEREFFVPPLPVLAEEDSLIGLSRIPAIALFVDRAQAVRPDFQLTRANAALVVALCQKLEGSPLAIELAAARAQYFLPAQMLARLSDRFALLATRRADKDARHRSLWAAIAWSVDLLPPPLRQFWRRLSVFRGGVTADAAQAVTGEAGALEALTQLRERSLLAVEEASNELRFRQLESLREFAEADMDSEERDAAIKHHGAFFLTLAESSEEPLRGSQQAAWLETLEVEHDNFRAALSRSDAETAQRLAAALWGFWERRGHLRECREWLERLLALSELTAGATRAKALDRLGAALNALGETEQAAKTHAQTLALYQELGDDKGVALAWNRLAIAAHQRGDYDAARAAFLEALTLERTLGNGFNIGSALIGLGIVSQTQGYFDEARQWLVQGLAQMQELGSSAHVADTLLNLANVHLDIGEFEEAQAELHRAAVLFEELGDQWSKAYTTLGLAIVASHQGQFADAEPLAREALDVLREVGDQPKAARAQCELGILALLRADWRQAGEHLRASLELYRQLGQVGMYPMCLRELGALAAARGQFARAARLLAAAEAQREQTNAPLAPADYPRYEQTLTAVRTALGEPAFQEHWAEGRLLLSDQFISEALTFQP